MNNINFETAKKIEIEKPEGTFKYEKIGNDIWACSVFVPIAHSGLLYDRSFCVSSEDIKSRIEQATFCNVMSLKIE